MGGLWHCFTHINIDINIVVTCFLFIIINNKDICLFDDRVDNYDGGGDDDGDHHHHHLHLIGSNFSADLCIEVRCSDMVAVLATKRREFSFNWRV